MIARVLVVDDDDQVRRSIAWSLARAGFEVVTADDGAPAIRLSDIATFDLIVVDYNMKLVPGVDVVRHFKARYGSRIYCAVLSGDDDDLTRAACLDAGADDVFVKPAPPSELRRRLIDAVQSLRGSSI